MGGCVSGTVVAGWVPSAVVPVPPVVGAAVVGGAAVVVFVPFSPWRTATVATLAPKTPRISTASAMPRSRLRWFPPDCLERVTGIEPAFSAWKADALPLSYTREMLARPNATLAHAGPVGEGGFEPPTACPQSRCATTAPLPGLRNRTGGRPGGRRKARLTYDLLAQGRRGRGGACGGRRWLRWACVLASSRAVVVCWPPRGRGGHRSQPQPTSSARSRRRRLTSRHRWRHHGRRPARCG